MLGLRSLLHRSLQLSIQAQQLPSRGTVLGKQARQQFRAVHSQQQHRRRSSQAASLLEKLLRKLPSQQWVRAVSRL